MKKGILRLSALTVALILSSYGFADETGSSPSNDTQVTADNNINKPPSFPMANMPAALKFDYNDIERDDADDLKLVGFNFLMQANSWLYGGVGGYGATGGDLGGLFILGVDAGVKHDVYHNIGFDLGYFAGGGGAQHGDGGEHSGFMTRSSAELTYNFKFLTLGAGYSYIHYPDYDIDEGQYTVSLSLPLDILYGGPDYQGKEIANLGQIGMDNDKWFAFYKTFIGLTQQTYFLKATDDAESDNMQLLGVKMGVFATPHLYYFLSSAGAYDSDEDGYMDVFFGAGWHQQLSQRLALYLDGALGAGGGGDTDTGGGFIYKPEAGLAFDVTPTFTFKLGGGYIKGNGGEFEGPTATAGLYYNFLNAQPAYLAPPDLGINAFQFGGWRLSVGSETYNHPQRDDNKDEENIDLVTLNLDKMLNQNFYVTGQAASAYGGNAGSYATGMAGIGVETNTWARMRFGADVLAGAAGGASMAVGDGGVYQPEAGLSVDLTRHLTLQGKVGQIKAFDGDLNSTTYTVSLLMRFSTLQEKL